MTQQLSLDGELTVLLWVSRMDHFLFELGALIPTQNLDIV